MSEELRGRARNDWTRVLLEHGAEIPHYPGLDVVKPARLPPPPLLTGTDPEQWSLQLYSAYAGVVTHHYTLHTLPKRRLRLDDVHALPDRDQRLLLQAGPVLHERGTQPSAWCAFAIESWAKYGPARFSDSRPPLRWVYGKARLAKADLWYQWQGATTGGVRLVFVKQHRTLIKLYDRMRRAILAEAKRADLTTEMVRSIVAVTLPKDKYRRLVQEAQLEVEVTQAEINAGLRRGAYLWGK